MKYFIIAVLLVPVLCFGQFEEYIEKDPEPLSMTHRGGVFSIMETGSGLGGFYEIPIQNFMHITYTLNAIMIRDKNQIDSYDPITGNPRTYNKKNSVFLFDLMISLKKRLFPRSFDDSFRPYIIGAVGPVYGVNFQVNDFNNEELPTIDGWVISWSLGLGIDVDLNEGIYGGLRTQYRFMPFDKKIGETKDHSMIDIRFEIGQRF